MDQATRLRRREEARRRVRRQRRLAAFAVAGLLGLAIAAPLLIGGDAESSEEEARGPEPQRPPELPRGGRRIFPDHRVVAYYGAPQDEELGVLGIGTPDEAARRLRRQARAYDRGRRKVLPALELIAVIAARDSFGGRHSMRQPRSVIRRYLRAARRHRALLLLDIQPGRADFMEEARHLEPFLREPDVSLALDPEWHVGEGEVPGQVIGSVEARKVNEISAWLSGIVRERNLPEKLLVVHQFTEDMITSRELLERHPGVALTLNVDGFGTPALKIAKYREFADSRPRGAHSGFKLFFREDTELMDPREVLRLRPRPELVVYE